MSINLLEKEHLMAFKNLLESVKSKFRMVSPFIGFETSKILKDGLSKQGSPCTIITRFYREDFLNHASSLEGLKMLVESGIRIYALKGLHSKLYLFDRDIAIIGSANFTMGGVRFNHELSLMIEDEPQLTSQLCDYYDRLLGAIGNSGHWILTKEKIEEEIAQVDNILKNRRDKGVSYSNSHKFGADLKDRRDFSENDFLEEYIREQVSFGFDSGIWLKFEGTGENRIEPDDKYSAVKMRGNQKNITCFPRKPRGMADGDHVFLSAVSSDKNGIATPMIVGRARTHGFKPKNIASDDHFNEHGWMREYPYYCELYDIEILDTEVENCISLDSLLRSLGSDLYPSTQGKVLKISELRARHYQKSHLRLTPVAKRYIDNLFDSLGKKYGITKF